MAEISAHGDRKRKVYKTKSEAKTFIDLMMTEIKNLGASSFGLEERDRIDAVQARGKLGDVPLSVAVDYYMSHGAVGSDATVGEVIASYLDAPGARGRSSVNRSEDTLKGIKWAP